jgi:hypothetical protein
VPEVALREIGSARRWLLVTSRHRLTWHDHRLGPRSGERAGTGRVGEWTIPLVVDGKPLAIRGGLWRSAMPSLWPWLALWLAALAFAAVVARVGGAGTRRASVYAATITSALLLVAVSVGFASGSARAGLARWADLVLPVLIALAAAAVFVLRPRQRYVACALVAGFVLAAALEDVPVFAHGFVVSTLPAGVVRAGVALALAASIYAIAVVVIDLLRERPGPRGRVGRAQPRLAVPKGKPR